MCISVYFLYCTFLLLWFLFVSFAKPSTTCSETALFVDVETRSSPLTKLWLTSHQKSLRTERASVNRLLDTRRRKPPPPREKPPPFIRQLRASFAQALVTTARSKGISQRSAEREQETQKQTKLHLGSDDDEEDTDEYSLFYSSAGRTQPITVPVTLNGLDTTMEKSEIDTSAALSLMNEHTYRSLNGSPPSIRLKTYTGVHVMFCIKHSRLIWISLLSLAKDALC